MRLPCAIARCNRFGGLSLPASAWLNRGFAPIGFAQH